MGKIHYELGVRMQRRRSPLRAVGTKWAVIAFAAVSILGFGGLHAYNAQNSKLAHRHNRIRTSNPDSTLSNPWRLHVRPAEVITPTATPSGISVTTDTSDHKQPDVVTVQSQTPPMTEDVAAVPEAPQTDTAVPSNSTVQPETPSVTPVEVAPTPTPTPTPTPQPVTIPAVQVKLPVITAPQSTVSVVPNPIPLPAITLPTPVSGDLTDAAKKDAAMQLVSSAENSSLNWKSQYGYIEDIEDGRGYTGGIIGFTSGTHDMLELVRYYTKLKPSNSLATYLPALQKVDGSSSHAGLDPGFTAAWKAAASDPVFQRAQNDERDRVYFDPSVSQAKSDGLRALGQFIYYDAIVMHGPGNDSTSFGGIRAAALKKAKTPAQGGDETAYLNAFLDARVSAMKSEAAHDDVDRVETEQRLFLKAGNLNLNTPLSWSVYGDPYKIQ